MFNELNEKAIECMNKEEPENALEYFKKLNSLLK